MGKKKYNVDTAVYFTLKKYSKFLIPLGYTFHQDYIVWQKHQRAGHFRFAACEERYEHSSQSESTRLLRAQVTTLLFYLSTTHITITDPVSIQHIVILCNVILLVSILFIISVENLKSKNHSLQNLLISSYRPLQTLLAWVNYEKGAWKCLKVAQTKKAGAPPPLPPPKEKNKEVGGEMCLQ